MNGKLWTIAVLAGAILMSGCAGKASDSDKETNTVSSSEQNEKKATSGITASNSLPLPVFFEATDIEAKEVSSAVFSESKLTMINVWATYCNPCLQEMPDLGELAGEYEKEEVQIIGIISDVQEGSDQDVLDAASGLIEETKADYPHLLVNESLYKAMLTDVAVVPTTIFFDKHGIVLDTVTGSRTKDEWKEIIDGLLEEQ